MTQSIFNETFYAGLQHLPRIRYPWPDLIHPDFQQLREAYYAWIDRDYGFQTRAAREKHKRHNLVDIAARGFPFLRSVAELRPIANYTANGAMMDDYFDHCSRGEMLEIVKRIQALLTGDDPVEPDDRFMRQWWLLRQEAIQCDIPDRIYRKLVQGIIYTFNGYAEEKPYYRANVPPPLAVYTVIREATSGGIPYCRYLCMQKDYRLLPDEILDHPHLLKMYAICTILIGIHNDFISLPKELHREGDTMNLVKVLQHEHKVSLETAYRMGLEQHDNYVKDFLVLQEHLPDFGTQWNQMVREYITDLGIMVAGVYAWHTQDTTRYVPDGYVAGEFVSRDPS